MRGRAACSPRAGGASCFLWHWAEWGWLHGEEGNNQGSLSHCLKCPSMLGETEAQKTASPSGVSARSPASQVSSR